jgi:hypothetical protein
VSIVANTRSIPTQRRTGRREAGKAVASHPFLTSTQDRLRTTACRSYRKGLTTASLIATRTRSGLSHGHRVGRALERGPEERRPSGRRGGPAARRTVASRLDRGAGLHGRYTGNQDVAGTAPGAP